MKRLDCIIHKRPVCQTPTQDLFWVYYIYLSSGSIFKMIYKRMIDMRNMLYLDLLPSIQMYLQYASNR